MGTYRGRISRSEPVSPLPLDVSPDPARWARTRLRRAIRCRDWHCVEGDCSGGLRECRPDFRPTLSDSRDRPTHSHRAPSGALPTQIPPPAVGRRIGLPFEGLIMSEAIILFGRGMAAKATTISRCACVGTNGFGPPRPTILRQVDCCTAERSALFRPDQAIGGSDRRPRSHQRLSDLNSAGGPRGLCGLRSATKIGDSVGAGFTRFARDPSVRGKACRRASHRKRHTSRPCSARRH